MPECQHGTLLRQIYEPALQQPGHFDILTPGISNQTSSQQTRLKSAMGSRRQTTQKAAYFRPHTSHPGADQSSQNWRAMRLDCWRAPHSAEPHRKPKTCSTESCSLCPCLSHMPAISSGQLQLTCMQHVAQLNADIQPNLSQQIK